MGKIPESTSFKISDFIFRFRESSQRFVVEILTQNFAFNLSGTLFFIGLGCSLKWWYKDQLFITLLKQNLPAFSQPEQKISWETGEYLIGEQTRQFVKKNNGIVIHDAAKLQRSCKGEGLKNSEMDLFFTPQMRNLSPCSFSDLIDRVDVYSNSVVINLRSPWQKHAYHRFVGIFPELSCADTAHTSSMQVRRLPEDANRERHDALTPEVSCTMPLFPSAMVGRGSAIHGAPSSIFFAPCSFAAPKVHRVTIEDGRRCKEAASQVQRCKTSSAPNSLDASKMQNREWECKKATKREETKYTNSVFKKYTFWGPAKNWFKLSARGLCILNDASPLISSPTFNYFGVQHESTLQRFTTFFRKPLIQTLEFPFYAVCEIPEKNIVVTCSNRNTDGKPQLLKVVGEKEDALAEQDFAPALQLLYTSGEFTTPHALTPEVYCTMPLGGKGAKVHRVENKKSPSQLASSMHDKARTLLCIEKVKPSAQKKHLFRPFDARRTGTSLHHSRILKKGLAELSVIVNNRFFCDGINVPTKKSSTKDNMSPISSGWFTKGAMVANGKLDRQTKNFSYPLEGTQKMNGWQLPVNKIFLNSYLDEIPYKLENTFWATTRQIDNRRLELCNNNCMIRQDSGDLKNKDQTLIKSTKKLDKGVTGSLPPLRKEKFTMPLLPSSMVDGDAPPYTHVTPKVSHVKHICQLIGIKQLLINELQILVNSIPVIFVDSARESPTLRDSVNRSSYLESNNQANNVKSSIRDAQKKGTYLTPNSNSLHDLCTFDVEQMGSSFDEGNLDSNALVASPLHLPVEADLSLRSPLHPRLYISDVKNAYELEEKSTQQKAMHLVDSFSLLKSLGITFNNLSYLKDPPVLLPINQDASFWKWNRKKVGMSSSSYSLLGQYTFAPKVHHVKKVINQRCKEKIKNTITSFSKPYVHQRDFLRFAKFGLNSLAKHDNSNIVTDTTFHFDPNTMTWQVLQQLNCGESFQNAKTPHDVTCGQISDFSVSLKEILQKKREEKKPAIQKHTLPSSMVSTKRVHSINQIRLQQSFARINTAPTLRYSGTVGAIGESPTPLHLCTPSKREEGASCTGTGGTDSTYINKSNASLKIDNINPVDTQVSLINKQVRLMSGYIYPDTQSEFLMPDFYRWTYSAFPLVGTCNTSGLLSKASAPKVKVCAGISPVTLWSETDNKIVAPLERLKKANLFSTDGDKNLTPFNPNCLLYSKKFREITRLGDNACLFKVCTSGAPTTIGRLSTFSSNQSLQRCKEDASKANSIYEFAILDCESNQPLLAADPPPTLLYTPGVNNTSELGLPKATSDSSLHKNVIRKLPENSLDVTELQRVVACAPLPTIGDGSRGIVHDKHTVEQWNFEHHLGAFPGFIKPNQFILSINQIAQGNNLSEDLFTHFYDVSLNSNTYTGSKRYGIINSVEGVHGKKQNLTQNKKGASSCEMEVFDCSTRKTAYNGIVVRRNPFTKDFQLPKKRLERNSILGALLFGPENPFTDRQSHFFGQRRLSTVDVNVFQRDYLRQLGRETLLQSNPKEFTYGGSVERVKILSFSKAINSFLSNKRRYAYLLEEKDQWHLLFQEQLRTALEDTRKYPPLIPEESKDHGSGRIKVSAPLMMARFPKKSNCHKVLAHYNGIFAEQIELLTVHPRFMSIELLYNGVPNEYRNLHSLIDSRPSALAPSLHFPVEYKISPAHCAKKRDNLQLHCIESAPSPQAIFTETYSSQHNSAPLLDKSLFPMHGAPSSIFFAPCSFAAPKVHRVTIGDGRRCTSNNNLSVFLGQQWFTQEPLNAYSWLIVSQWSFLVALLLWIEQTFLADIFPALFALEQLLLGTTGIKSDDRTHVTRVSKGDIPKFKDIAGIDGLLGELAELVLFLRGHKKRLWNKKSSYGVLLTGPPGTGKTFLVRALANEAKVPVLILSAGVLTANKTNNSKPSWSIRHAFRRAKQLAPCILFIDEIDALGRSRGNIVTDINEIVASAPGGQNVQATPLSNSNFFEMKNSFQFHLQCTSGAKANLVNTSLQQQLLSATEIQVHQIQGTKSLRELASQGKSISAYNQIDRYSLCADTSWLINAFPFGHKSPTLGIETKIADRRSTDDKTLSTSSYAHASHQPVQSMQTKENIKRKFGPLTQLLVSMDGVSSLAGVLIIGATNRPESLDPALTRPGRFERIIRVEKPAEQKRIEILKLYSRNLGIQKQIPWSYLANRTMGLTAADLAVAMNYSSLKAILQGTMHTIETIEYGLDSIARFSNREVKQKQPVINKKSTENACTVTPNTTLDNFNSLQCTGGTEKHDISLNTPLVCGQISDSSVSLKDKVQSELLEVRFTPGVQRSCKEQGKPRCTHEAGTEGPEKYVAKVTSDAASHAHVKLAPLPTIGDGSRGIVMPLRGKASLASSCEAKPLLETKVHRKRQKVNNAKSFPYSLDVAFLATCKEQRLTKSLDFLIKPSILDSQIALGSACGQIFDSSVSLKDQGYKYINTNGVNYDRFKAQWVYKGCIDAQFNQSICTNRCITFKEGTEEVQGCLVRTPTFSLQSTPSVLVHSGKVKTRRHPTVNSISKSIVTTRSCISDAPPNPFPSDSPTLLSNKRFDNMHFAASLHQRCKGAKVHCGQRGTVNKSYASFSLKTKTHKLEKKRLQRLTQIAYYQSGKIVVQTLLPLHPPVALITLNLSGPTTATSADTYIPIDGELNTYWSSFLESRLMGLYSGKASSLLLNRQHFYSCGARSGLDTEGLINSLDAAKNRWLPFCAAGIQGLKRCTANDGNLFQSNIGTEEIQTATFLAATMVNRWALSYSCTFGSAIHDAHTLALQEADTMVPADTYGASDTPASIYFAPTTKAENIMHFTRVSSVSLCTKDTNLMNNLLSTFGMHRISPEYKLSEGGPKTIVDKGNQCHPLTLRYPDSPRLLYTPGVNNMHEAPTSISFAPSSIVDGVHRGQRCTVNKSYASLHNKTSDVTTCQSYIDYLHSISDDSEERYHSSLENDKPLLLRFDTRGTYFQQKNKSQKKGTKQQLKFVSSPMLFYTPGVNTTSLINKADAKNCTYLFAAGKQALLFSPGRLSIENVAITIPLRTHVFQLVNPLQFSISQRDRFYPGWFRLYLPDIEATEFMKNVANYYFSQGLQTLTRASSIFDRTGGIDIENPVFLVSKKNIIKQVSFSAVSSSLRRKIISDRENGEQLPPSFTSLPYSNKNTENIFSVAKRRLPPYTRAERGASSGLKRCIANDGKNTNQATSSLGCIESALQKLPFDYNDVFFLEKELIYHSLVNNCFSKTFFLIDQNRQLIDYFADYLVRFQILRQHQILYLFSTVLFSCKKRT